jgi:hypothetical protein
MLLWTAAIGSEIDRLGQEASTMRELRTKLLGVGSPVMEEVLAAFLIGSTAQPPPTARINVENHGNLNGCG